MFRHYIPLTSWTETKKNGRSQRLRNLRPTHWMLGHWDCGFESHLRHGCLSSSIHHHSLVTPNVVVECLILRLRVRKVPGSNLGPSDLLSSSPPGECWNSSPTAHLWRRRGERRYSSYSFTTSVLDGVSGQHHASATLYRRGKNPRHPLHRRLGGPQSRSGIRG
jgi:hypothetical protein